MEGALSGRQLDRKQHQLQVNYVFLTWLVTMISKIFFVPHGRSMRSQLWEQFFVGTPRRAPPKRLAAFIKLFRFRKCAAFSVMRLLMPMRLVANTTTVLKDKRCKRL